MKHEDIAMLVDRLVNGDMKALARAVSMAENAEEGCEDMMSLLPIDLHIPIIGITGPPGAGKSSLINALTKEIISQGKKVAVIAIDPTSPFNHGAFMGDRIRMSDHFLHENVFIRSMATRGSLGGLSPRIFESADIFRASGFDFIFIETVGVGQNEVDIAALADTTLLVLVPESGDEIQNEKSGIMEIADIFVVNKSDREGADAFFKNLKLVVQSKTDLPVLKTIATQSEGISELMEMIKGMNGKSRHAGQRTMLLAEKALSLIREQRTRDISFLQLTSEIENEMHSGKFNLYRFVKNYGK